MKLYNKITLCSIYLNSRKFLQIALGETYWLIPITLFTFGCAIAVHFAEVGSTLGETSHAADALLHRGYIGDPFLLPTGASAHVSPLQVLYMAGIYALFGVNTQAANIALGVITAGIFAVGVAVMLQLLLALRISESGRWLAVGLLLSTSFVAYYEVTYCRVWEQPLSAVVLLSGWLMLVRHETNHGPQPLLIMATLTGLSVLLTASILPSLLTSLLTMLWTGRQHPRAARYTFISILIVLAFVLSWGLRNELVLGKFIFTRSNFGLELAVGNQPGAQGPSSLGWTAPIHPSISRTAAEQVQTVGEVAYMASMMKVALGWIEATPVQFAHLTATRAWLSVFPDGRIVTWFPVLGSTGAVLLLSILGALKLAACMTSVALRYRLAQIILFGVLPLAPYWITHIYLRYQLLTYFTTIVLITAVTDLLMQRHAVRIGSKGPFM